MEPVTARDVDPDFIALPRHRLADAALSAALQAGAEYADLRIHAITNEVVQLRDGELETAVTDREIGLAVRVIVDGTWGSPRTPSWPRRSRPRRRAGRSRWPGRWAR